ncbi:hypothetical protein BBJ29_001326 [Phytophthora kernoviae]|uniref:Peptidase C1A papain C-terminal domain-containing protein n=1 Tax=Phytophthora kernoviae TaxID=325452 RepID=A0A3F2S1V5_9STRA|nr:hypothetical protein BBJ29_001326 [Phytophthora kernoviae]RLN68127.1 hypothetical protein BBP00_00001212 [Phytophthora kernoviae]
MTDRSLGALVDCPAVRSTDSPCLWAGHNGEVVDTHTLRELLIQRNLVSFGEVERNRRNLQAHMTYIEDVDMYAKSVNHQFSYQMGVNERHLTSSTWRRLTPQQLVDQEVKAAKSRRLVAEASGSTGSTVSSAGSSEYWNWCDTDNSFGYTVCSSVKSQQNCGSCWAFAAADAIETAVCIAENASAAVALAPQQFLTCSTLETTQTFDYCWATDSGVDGATWMETEIKWESQNDGCNGGMTHGAFIDAAQNAWGLVTELTMPYDDSSSSSTSSGNGSSSCSVSSNDTAASITGWEQVVGADCTASSNCTILLRTALEQQPIAVAINSADPFGDYAGGFYSCPNDGDLSSKNDVNHALLLVGYGTDATEGDYWILKNSYGSSWGASGFIKLVADAKVNCGLNIFPVIPTGASAGAAATSVDGGGDKVFVGLSPTAWIAVAAVATIFTVVMTAFGMLISQPVTSTIALLATGASAAPAKTTDRSLGALVDCPTVRSADYPCLWAGENGQVVSSHALRELLVQRHVVSLSEMESSRRNLQAHMSYIEDVDMYAKEVGHEFSYHMGVTERHLTSSTKRELTVEQLVDQEVRLAHSRRLTMEASNSTSGNVTSAGSSEYWNWCDKDNSYGYSVCSTVKSQKSCGSCWSFVAADAIETAVVIAEKASQAVSLSPQQFLTCSSLQTTQTFEYCWASDSGVDGASWMQSEIKWESQNDGCNGGMTHGAFMDAAQNKWGLVTELTMPYDDSGSAISSGTNDSSFCSVGATNAAASITGWEQVVGGDCTTTNNCTDLLRTALEKQPIAVAITSNGQFQDYAGGFYTCPNDGDMASKNDLNHALLLVGYGTDSSVGDYWILKNSYGSSWGAGGFMKLVGDGKINCGLNVFPVIPTGASAGAAASSGVDGGGDKVFVGLSPGAWIAVAAVATIFTVVTTGIGMFISKRRFETIRKQNTAMYAVRTPTNAD